MKRDCKESGSRIEVERRVEQGLVGLKISLVKVRRKEKGFTFDWIKWKTPELRSF